MKKQIGKLYVSRHTENRNNIIMNFELVIFCTGLGKSEKTYSGVVVKQTDDTSDIKLGDYSDVWTWHSDVFTEYVGDIIINNLNWKERIELGACQG